MTTDPALPSARRAPSLRRKVGLACGVLVVAVLATGYVTAWRSLKPCAEDTWADLQRRGVAGFDLTGKRISLERRDVDAMMAGPFLVETSYLVRQDLHGTRHTRRYLALPWGIFLRAEKSDHYVHAPAWPAPHGDDIAVMPVAST